MDALGIDIGGTSVKAAMVRDGRVEWTGTSAAYARPGTDQIVDAIRQAVAGRDPTAGAVGLCCPGLLDRSRGMITLAVNVPGLVGVQLDELVGRALGAVPRVEILSDSNAVGYDLYVSRQVRGRLLCLTLGTGVGASVVDDGKFLHVSGESPGHFGQLDVSLSDDPPVGPDGGAGSLEAYIGAPALLARYGKEAIGRLTANDPPVRALVRAIRIAHAVYRPDHVALCGGVGIRAAGMVSQIKAAVDRGLTSVARPDWKLVAGEDDFHAARGVARWAALAEPAE